MNTTVLVLSILALVLCCIREFIQERGKEPDEKPGKKSIVRWRMTAALAFAGLAVSGSVEFGKYRAEAKREEASRLSQERVLSAIDKMYKALDGLSNGLRLQPKATSDAITPQIDQIRQALQSVENDIENGTRNDATLSRAEQSLAQAQARICEFSAMLQEPIAATPFQQAATESPSAVAQAELRNPGGGAANPVLSQSDQRADAITAPNFMPSPTDKTSQPILISATSPSSILPMASVTSLPASQPAVTSSNTSTRPAVTITVVPHAGEGGEQPIETISGRVTGVIFADYQIVLYAYAGRIWWIQPFDTQPHVAIDQAGSWTSPTHLGSVYAALLIRKSAPPPQAQIEVLPTPGGNIAAIGTVKGAGPLPPQSQYPTRQ